MRNAWPMLPLDKALTRHSRIIGGPFGSDLTQADYTATGVPVIRVANQVGTRVEGEFVFVSDEKAKRLKANIAQPGDIVVVQRGSTYGKVSRIPFGGQFSRYVICQSQMAISVDEETLCSEFLFQVLLSPIFEQHVEREVIQTGQPHINLGILKAAKIPLPPLSEQRKIAAILRTWDGAIEKLSVLRKAKARRLEGMRAGLLFRASNWPIRRLAEVTRELTSRNGQLALGRSTVMGVTNSRGIVPMREQTVAGDISRYKLLPPLGFAYNPMRINVGSIAMNAREATYLVSPDYVVFACRSDGLEPDYLNHLRQTRWWLHHINAGGSGSVRQRTYYDDLAALQLHLPDIAEQRSIVAVLNTAEADVELTDREITALTRQKRGLMQKLLTGEWPVNIEGDAS